VLEELCERFRADVDLGHAPGSVGAVTIRAIVQEKSFAGRRLRKAREPFENRLQYRFRQLSLAIGLHVVLVVRMADAPAAGYRRRKIGERVLELGAIHAAFSVDTMTRRANLRKISLRS
jgi:hypothetical protein